MAIFKAPEARNKDLQDAEELRREEKEEGGTEVVRDDGMPSEESLEKIMSKDPKHMKCGKGDGVIELIIKIMS